MEPLIVNGLVLLFFILLLIFVMGVLANHPYNEPSALVQVSSPAPDNKIAYGVLIVLVAFLVVIAMVSERERSIA